MFGVKRMIIAGLAAGVVVAGWMVWLVKFGLSGDWKFERGPVFEMGSKPEKPWPIRGKVYLGSVKKEAILDPDIRAGSGTRGVTQEEFEAIREAEVGLRVYPFEIPGSENPLSLALDENELNEAMLSQILFVAIGSRYDLSCRWMEEEHRFMLERGFVIPDPYVGVDERVVEGKTIAMMGVRDLAYVSGEHSILPADIPPGVDGYDIRQKRVKSYYAQCPLERPGFYVLREHRTENFDFLVLVEILFSEG